MFKKIFLCFCIIITSVYLNLDTKQSSVDAVDSPTNLNQDQPDENDSTFEVKSEFYFSCNNLQDKYSDKSIVLQFDYNIEEKSFVVDYSNSNVAISSITKDDGASKINVMCQIYSEESILELSLKSGTKEIVSYALYFFKSTDEEIFSSTISFDNARIKKLDFELDQGIITENQYYYYRNKIFTAKNIGVEIRPFTGTTGPNVGEHFVLDGKIEWIDDYGVKHPAAYILYDIYQRIDGVMVYHGGGSTDNEGKYNGYYNDGNFKRDIYMRINAKSARGSKVVSTTAKDYFVEELLASNVSPGMQIGRTLTYNMDSDFGKALQIACATYHFDNYAYWLNQSLELQYRKNIPGVTIYYPYGNGSSYYRYNKIYISGAARQSSSYPHAYASWDLIGHEYGHYIQDIFNIEDNPGGEHILGKNASDTFFEAKDSSGGPLYTIEAAKSMGIKLAWAEGWATYFSIMAQKYSGARSYGLSISNVKFVNDNSYTSYRVSTFSLDNYGLNGNNAKGEADEVSVSNFLYKLSNHSILYDDFDLWSIVVKNNCKTFSSFISETYKTYITKSVIGQLLEKFKMAPTSLSKSGDSLAYPPSFSWVAQGGSVYFINNRFTVLITDPYGKVLVQRENILNTEYTLTKDEWSKVLDNVEEKYYVEIIGYANTAYLTGPYRSEKKAFAIPYSSDTKEEEAKTLITSEDYGYKEQYYFEEQTKLISVSDLIFNTKRLRTGYISKEYVVMSPRREGAGIAYIEYEFDCSISKIEVDLALWSASEILRANECTAVIQYKSLSGEWVAILDLLNDITLTTDRKNPVKYTITFPENVSEFRFYSVAPAIGVSNNTGRLCIGNMYVFRG